MSHKSKSAKSNLHNSPKTTSPGSRGYPKTPLLQPGTPTSNIGYNFSRASPRQNMNKSAHKHSGSHKMHKTNPMMSQFINRGFNFPYHLKMDPKASTQEGKKEGSKPGHKSPYYWLGGANNRLGMHPDKRGGPGNPNLHQGVKKDPARLRSVKMVKPPALLSLISELNLPVELVDKKIYYSLTKKALVRDLIFILFNNKF